MSNPKLITNAWTLDSASGVERAQILEHDVHPEGLDLERTRFVAEGRLQPSSKVGHIATVIRGRGQLHLAASPGPLALEAGVHAYLPPGAEAVISGEAGLEMVLVSAGGPEHAKGDRFLLRDEQFLAACASPGRALRWRLTPQYLSRRVFLYHDQTLLSKGMHPVSWFHTTMFDVSGLPENEEGESVFKMSYNYRSEFNVCYDVQGTARVRMAQHPYRPKGQAWSDWYPLDSDSTYHLNESSGGPEEEWLVNPASGIEQPYRNKHEVFIRGGHVSLFCLFDPAPTGVEHHRPGEYSEYGPLSLVLGTDEYRAHQSEMADFDAMVDELSMAKARGELDSLSTSVSWQRYLRGQAAQAAVEQGLYDALEREGAQREKVLERWMRRPPA